MLRQFSLLIVVFFISFSSNAQELNAYKYVVVPDSYEFLKGKKDQYQLNSLTQFLFNKYGFNAVLASETFPEDLQSKGCTALYADVENMSSMFTIKLQVVLKDCKNNVVFTSVPGRSKSKEFKKGYQEALRAAFMDIKKLNYFYKKSSNEKVNSSVIQKEEVVTQDTQVSTSVMDSRSPAVQESIPSSGGAVVNGVSSIDVKNVLYVFKGVKYDFKKAESGFDMVQQKEDGSKVVIGQIFATSRSNNYLVKAAELSGNGYFDSFGNFILERINPATGKLITDTFAREDQ